MDQSSQTYNEALKDAKKVAWVVPTAVIVVLSPMVVTMVIGMLRANNSRGEIIIAITLVLLMFVLAYSSFALFYHWKIKHPVILLLNSTKELVDISIELSKDATAILKPRVLVEQKSIVIGSSTDKDNEMMEVLFKDFFDTPQTIDIQFMGTAYGAFSSGKGNSFGFLDALIKHIKKCKEHGNPKDPFGEMNFVCCTNSLYNLSAKYLSFSIFNQIQKSSLIKGRKPLRILYLHEDCMPATLILKGNGNASEIAFISPSIGKHDKDFLGNNYPIGIVIKNPEPSSGLKGSAHDTIARMENQFAATLDSNSKIIENWSYTDNILTITNVQPIFLDLNDLDINLIAQKTDLTNSKAKILSEKLIRTMIKSHNHALESNDIITIAANELPFVCEFIQACIQHFESQS